MGEILSSRGKRFNAVINGRASELLKHYVECNDPKQAKNSEDLLRRNANIERVICYRSEQNPDRSYNHVRVKASSKKEKCLTVEALEDYLHVLEWTYKDFLEFCQEENLNYTVQEAYTRPRPKDWKYLEWPDAQMKLIAHTLDILDENSVDRVEQLIDMLLPAQYWTLMAEMEKESTELGSEKNERIYVQQEDYVPEKTIDNMGMRIFLTLQYVEPDSEKMKSRIIKANAEYDYPRPYSKRHYWIFPVEKIDSICREFKLSPHWVFLGNKDKLVLAEKKNTERIMDKYIFLPEEEKKIVYHSVEKSYSEGVLK